MTDDLAPARGILLGCIAGLACWSVIALAMLWGAAAGNILWVLLLGAAQADGGGWLFMALGAAVAMEWRR